MNSIEEAYQVIAENLVSRVSGHWMLVTFQTKILNRNCSSMTTTELGNNAEKHFLSLGMVGALAVDDACIFLRDNLLATTGQRIWGLIFTLYPDGKFNIEYDYNKPEGYEESDETITLEEALKGLPITKS